MNRIIRAIPIKAIMIFSVLFLSISGTGFAQNGLTPEDVAKIKNVGAVYLSQDGSTAAYTVLVPADPFKENAPASAHLYLLDVESGETKPFITGRSVSGVAFRPNHNSISYIDRQSGDETRSLYEISLDGGEAQKLFSFETNISGYEWAPDGNHIIFRASEPKKSSASPLPYQPEIYEENLTNTWAYIQNVSREGHMPHRIEIDGNVYAAQWSPDQSKVAVAVAPTSLVDDSFMAQRVYIVDHHTREILAEVDHTGKLGSFKWSPDSQNIAMIAAADINDPIAGRLKIVDTEDGSATLLQRDFPECLNKLNGPMLTLFII